MRLRSHHVFAWTVGLCLLAAASALNCGCNNARFRRDQKIRSDRIRDNVGWYADYSTAGVERARTTMDLHRELRTRHADYLAETTDLIREEHRYDVNRWYENRPERRARLRGEWDGKPQNIPEAWADMIY